MDGMKGKKPKQANVQVDTLTTVHDFIISSSTTGTQLFHQVALVVGLRELWPFGLCYTDRKKLHAWLNIKKKVFSQDVGRKRPVQLKLRVRFYPEDVEELTDPASLRQLYLEVQQVVVTGSLQCPVEVAIQLAAYAFQATDQTMSSDHVWTEVSHRTEQWDLTKTPWKDQVVCLYEDLKDQMSMKSAMLEYLKLAQRMEGFGVSKFDIKMKRGKGLMLGISTAGMSVQNKNSGEQPVIVCPWDKILSMAFSGKTFTVKMLQKTSPDFVFVSGRARTNRQILALCIGYYELFIRRRQAAEKERKERTSETPCPEETSDGGEKMEETGPNGSGAAFPREEAGGLEEEIVPMGEWHWEKDGEKEGEIQDEMSSTDGTTSSMGDETSPTCSDTRKSFLDEGENLGPPIPPKTYLLRTTSDDYKPTENVNLEWSEMNPNPCCHPGMEHTGANELWVTFNDDDVMNREFESTQVAPPFLVVRHGSPEVAPVVGSEVAVLEVTPVSRSLCLAAIETIEDVEEYQPLGYSGTSVVHLGAPLSDAEIHKVQILSFTKKVCPEQKRCETNCNTAQSGHSVSDNCEPSIREGNTKQRVMLFEAM